MCGPGARLHARTPFPLSQAGVCWWGWGEGSADEGKPEGPFCEYVDEGHVRTGGASVRRTR